jgi:hypothetical protein
VGMHVCKCMGVYIARMYVNCACVPTSLCPYVTCAHACELPEVKHVTSALGLRVPKSGRRFAEFPKGLQQTHERGKKEVCTSSDDYLSRS